MLVPVLLRFGRRLTLMWFVFLSLSVTLHVCAYMHVRVLNYTCVYREVCVCVCLHVSIQRERERDYVLCVTSWETLYADQHADNTQTNMQTNMQTSVYRKQSEVFELYAFVLRVL